MAKGHETAAGGLRLAAGEGGQPQAAGRRLQAASALGLENRDDAC
ncbi:MAG TPA: hypothetical protein VJ865_04705 [Gemmatimonadaceae bacterium]|nr:hypothetical protein [Gemmatimonadaceae bacterium]